MMNLENDFTTFLSKSFLSMIDSLIGNLFFASNSASLTTSLPL